VGMVEHEWSEFKFKLLMRCKWDLFMPALRQGADIKTTTATTQKSFEDACNHFQYFRSRYIYMAIENTEKDMIIGVSKANQRIFKLPIVKGDKNWLEGKRQASELAFNFWYHFDGFAQNNLVLI